MWTFWNILAVFPFESAGNLYVDTSDTKTHELCMIFSTNTMNINERAWFHVWLQTHMHVDIWFPSWWFILSQLTRGVRVVRRKVPFKLSSQKPGHESWFFSILCFGKTLETAYTFLHKTYTLRLFLFALTYWWVALISLSIYVIHFKMKHDVRYYFSQLHTNHCYSQRKVSCRKIS